MSEASIEEINAVARDAALDLIERGQPVAWLAWERSGAAIFQPPRRTAAATAVGYHVRWSVQAGGDTWRVYAATDAGAEFVEVTGYEVRAAVSAAAAIIPVTRFMLETRAVPRRPVGQTWEERREELLSHLPGHLPGEGRVRQIHRLHVENRDFARRAAEDELASIERELSAMEASSMMLGGMRDFTDDVRRRYLHYRRAELRSMLAQLGEPPR